MRIISDRDWKEYKQLKHNVRVQNNFNSVRSMISLENDIDSPIRNIVRMFALLGCDPVYSCCGFDYDGQPLHKSHEYGCTYFHLGNNDKTKEIIKVFQEDGIVYPLTNEHPRWEWWERGSIILMSAFTLFHDKKYPWIQSTECIHYSEIAAINIQLLESNLLRCRNYFVDEVVLVDTNSKNKKRHDAWQYPPLEPWTIKKEDVYKHL